jgi:hypothetical protein
MIKPYKFVFRSMFSNYIFVHNLISFKNCKIVSSATFVNKLDVALTLSDECQQHLRSRLKYFLRSNHNEVQVVLNRCCMGHGRLLYLQKVIY